MTRVLDLLANTRGLSEEIRVDHGPEFICHALRSWCEHHSILLRYIDPGRAMQNGHVESFNGRFRDECLNTNWFTSLAHARKMISEWRADYNGERPHSSLEYRTPSEFAALLHQQLNKPTHIEKNLRVIGRAQRGMSHALAEGTQCSPEVRYTSTLVEKGQALAAHYAAMTLCSEIARFFTFQFSSKVFGRFLALLH